MDTLLYLSTVRTLEKLKEDCWDNKEIGAIDTGIKAIKKLKAYEDTGTTPEKIKELGDLYTEKCKEANELKHILKGRFTPEEYVRNYNALIEEESTKNAEPIGLHEDI